MRSKESKYGLGKKDKGKQDGRKQVRGAHAWSSEKIDEQTVGRLRGGQAEGWGGGKVHKESQGGKTCMGPAEGRSQCIRGCSINTT